MSTGWSVFGVDLSAKLMADMRADVISRYPQEACGVILGGENSASLTEAVPLRNALNSSYGFAFDESDYIQMLTQADKAGLAVKVIYHSHPDAGAYLSAQDQLAIAPHGQEIFPGVVHLVFSVRTGTVVDLAAYRFRCNEKDFEEARPTAFELPDLALRGGRSPLPINAVGGRLFTLRLSEREAKDYVRLAEGRQVPVDIKTAKLISAFGQGLLCPLTGFQRSEEERTISVLGRTPQGVSWRRPLALHVKTSLNLMVGQIVELAETASHGEHNSIALMAISSVTMVGVDKVRLAGPIFVYPSEQPDVFALRTQLLDLGAERVLAIPPSKMKDVESIALAGFDAVVAPEKVPGFPAVVMQPATDDLWLMAAMYQNAGATHFWIEPGDERRAIASALQIEPWCPELTE